MTAETVEINLQVKDGDPRKRAYFKELLREHADAVLPVWNTFGVIRKKLLTAEEATNDRKGEHMIHEIPYEDGPLFYRREHMAPEHMLGGTAAVRAIGQRLHQNGFLAAHHVTESELAFLVHDAGKEAEVQAVNWARAEQGMAPILRVVSGPFIHIGNEHRQQLQELLTSYEDRFNSPEVGIRAIAGYNFASDINKLRLAHADISQRVIDIQEQVAFTSDIPIQERIKTFNEQDPDQQALTVQMAVVHWVDDAFTNSMMDPNITTADDGTQLNTIDTRTMKVFSDPRNVILDEAWRDFEFGEPGEGAADMQRRVGHEVERFLAERLGIDNPITMPQIVSTWIKQDIRNYGTSATITNGRQN